MSKVYPCDYCEACHGVGFFKDVVGLGLEPNDPYSKPHVERCDTCQRFSSDKDALDHVIHLDVTFPDIDGWNQPDIDRWNRECTECLAEYPVDVQECPICNEEN